MKLGSISDYNESSIESIKAGYDNEHKILIVDDQWFNIEAIKIILKYKVGIDTSAICDFALNGK